MVQKGRSGVSLFSIHTKLCNPHTTVPFKGGRAAKSTSQAVKHSLTLTIQFYAVPLVKDSRDNRTLFIVVIVNVYAAI